MEGVLCSRGGGGGVFVVRVDRKRACIANENVPCLWWVGEMCCCFLNFIAGRAVKNSLSLDVVDGH